ncbi:hypothetical protein lerEdw1_011541 [Lerista edwardsae]|nr:hypothetical protein lerEdw1_011541 [Lerista edwardsae]
MAAPANTPLALRRHCTAPLPTPHPLVAGATRPLSPALWWVGSWVGAEGARRPAGRAQPRGCRGRWEPGSGTASPVQRPVRRAALALLLRERIMQPWLALLSLACQLSGSAGDPEPSPALPVHGVLGGSVVLPVAVRPALTVLEMEWSFEVRPGEVERFARLRNGALHSLDPPSRLVRRLEAANGTSLRIKALERGDGRVYRAHVTFAASARVQDEAFALAVHDPVPEPRLSARLLSSTPDGCNVTLRCQVPGKGALRVSWKGGSPLQALSEGAAWYRLSDNGTALHLSWKPHPADPPFVCLASSPAEQRNASLRLLGLCRRGSGEGAGAKAPLFFWVRIGLLGALAVQIFAVAWVSLPDRRDQRRS